MNILLINHYAGSVHHGMEYRPYYFAKKWVEKGHQVTIVASTYSHLRQKQPIASTDFTEEIIDGIRYIWLVGNEYEGNGLGRIQNMVSFVRKLYKYEKRILQLSEPDVIIASSTYPLDMYPANHLAKKAAAKLIFEVHDLWPLSPKELSGMSSWHPFIVIMQIAENFAYRKADAVVSLLPKAKEHMVQHGLKPEKFHYIPNGIYLEDWEQKNSLPEQMESTLLQYKKDGKFLIGYSGSHGSANALQYLIEAAEQLKDTPCEVVLVGKGPEKGALVEMAKEKRLTNVHFFDAIPKQSIPQFLDKMDALFIGGKYISLYRFGISPNKLLDYLMAGKPIVYSFKAGNNLVEESNAGITVEPENAKEIAGGIKQLIALSSEERLKMGENGKEFALQYHSYDVLVDQFLDVIKK